MFQETMLAIQTGDRARARDLLTRLIKRDANRADYWLWMSAVVDSQRERIYCLKEVLRLDPDNTDARRGLIMLGAAKPDQRLAAPEKLQRRNWRASLPQIAKPAERSPIKWKQVALVGVAGLVVLGLVAAGVIGGLVRKRPVSSGNYLLITAGPSPTFLPKATQAGDEQTAQTDGQELPPLAEYLNLHYTPTPMYVSTQHPADENFRIAMRSYDGGDWEGAIQYANFVLRAEPNSPDLHYLIGESYRQMGEYGQAEEAYRNALALDENFAPAHLGLARNELDAPSGSRGQALSELNRAISLDPNLYEARLELATIQIDAGSPEVALETLAPVEQLAPNSVLYHYLSGRAHLALKDMEPALQSAQQAYELDRGFLPAYRLLVEVYTQLDQPGQSIELLEIYTLYEPEDDTALVWLGQAYAAAGDTDKALDAFDRALKTNRFAWRAYVQRGKMHLENGDIEQAVDDLETAQRIDSRSFEEHMLLGQAYMQQEEFGAAYQQFNLADAYNETELQQAEMTYWRALSLDGLGEERAALRDYTILLALEDVDLPEEWLEQARQRLGVTPTVEVTPTATGKTATPTPKKATSTPTPTTRP